jgi:hypothetical protein
VISTIFIYLSIKAYLISFLPSNKKQNVHILLFSATTFDDDDGGISTQQCIREASHCSSTGRSEENRSEFALQRSVANSAVNIQAKKEAGSRELRGNQHILGGTIGTRNHLSQTSKRKHNSGEDNSEQASAKKKIRVRGAPRARILLENTATRHAMLQ